MIFVKMCDLGLWFFFVDLKMSEDGDEKPLQFHQMELDDRILKAIALLKWETPTLIQEKAIPLLLEGKDVLVRAKTGSGTIFNWKNTAFFPFLIHCCRSLILKFSFLMLKERLFVCFRLEKNFINSPFLMIYASFHHFLR